MFKKTNNNSPQLSVASSEAIIPDPWEEIETEPHTLSPVELDRWLRPEHPLIRAAASHPTIPAVPMPTVLLPPAHADRAVIPSSITVLLNNELKLPSGLQSIQAQIGTALTLLYWAMTCIHQPVVA